MLFICGELEANIWFGGKKGIWKYDGQKETLKAMEGNVPFAGSHKDYPLKQSPGMLELQPIEKE